jgi:hypothetical protein
MGIILLRAEGIAAPVCRLVCNDSAVGTGGGIKGAALMDMVDTGDLLCQRRHGYIRQHYGQAQHDTKYLFHSPIILHSDFLLGEH